MVQMKKIEHYLIYKSQMIHHLAFAAQNQSLEDSLYQLLCYHKVKDLAQEKYFSMSHEEHKVLHTMLIL